MAPKLRGALRRPAARPGVLRRPASRADEEENPPRPGERPLAGLTLQQLKQLKTVCLSDARYYGRVVQVAGLVAGTSMEDGELFVMLETTGTKDDELLRVLSGTPGRKLRVHICTEGCEGLLTDPLLVHGHSFEEVNLDRLPWLTNLEAARGVPAGGGPDELAKLRELQAKVREEEKRGDKKVSKKEKKRKRLEEKKGDEGRAEEPPKKTGGDLVVGQKALEDVFSATGLDPNPERRKKILRKAKRLGKGKKRRKKKSSSSSGDTSVSSTSSSSTSDGDDDSGLFGENTKLHRIWKRCPGALTAAAVREARQSLMDQTGTLWNINQSELPPIFTQYCRQQVILPHGVSPALVQEILTLSQVLDSLLLGRIAGSADIVCQRLKSLETLAKGSHWATGRQLELVRSDQHSMAEGSEALGAAKRAREEERLKSLLSKAPTGKGGEGIYGGKNRKGKATGKGKPDEGGKGRGGEPRSKDDGKHGVRK